MITETAHAEEVQDNQCRLTMCPFIEPEVKPALPVEIDIKTYAQQLVQETFGDGQWDSFNAIVNKESGHWKVIGDHPGASSAYGLFGFLNSTWSTVGCVKTQDQYEQVRCGIKYIEQRYGTPNKAWQFHRANNWY